MLGMGVSPFKRSSSGPRRAYYPSGPWIDENGKPCKSPTYAASDYDKKKRKKTEPPNPDPHNYKFVRVEEADGFLLVQLNYPDCTNYEGNKILLFRGVKLIDLVNQKYIDPHFFQAKDIASPIARFVPTEEGWKMGLTLITALKASTNAS
jgi:hypothetical protein